MTIHLSAEEAYYLTELLRLELREISRQVHHDEIMRAYSEQRQKALAALLGKLEMKADR